MRIPVHSGDSLVEFVRDDGALQRYCEAALLKTSNVEIVRRRRSVVRINLRAIPDDLNVRHGGGSNSAKYTYSEELANGPIPMLKRIDPETQQYVKWGAEDGFNPSRFNPDRIQPAAGARL